MKTYLFTLLVFFTCYFLVPITSTAQSQQDASLARKLDELIKQRLPAVGPGCVVLVAKKGQIIYKKAFGISDLRSKKPMLTDMIFRIGSMTKQYTAIAILQLVEQGKIALQDTIQRYATEFPSKGHPITIENVLSQTSGIPDYLTLQNHDPAKDRDVYTPAQGVDYFKDAALNFTPGSKFEYSNSNFYLLGYIIERVTGQSYDSYIKEHLLKPAGLNHTYYIYKGENIPNLTPGYSRPDGKNWEPAELQDPTVMYATGGLTSTVEDIFKWHQALSAGKPISTQTLKKAYTPFKLADGSLSEYAYGWFIRDLDGSTTIEHSGSTDGYQTDEIYLPDEDVFIVALFNGFEYDMDFIMLPNDIARLAAGKPLRPELKLNDDRLKQYTGTYTYNSEHQMIITFKDHQLLVDDTYPKDHLHDIKLYAKSNNRFYIKEAPIDFEFVRDPSSKKFMLVTYNAHGKDAEWKQ
jgi:CubicO group peptidase (beta-lactamase class C family)